MKTENDEIKKPQISLARKLARKLHKDAGIKDLPISLEKIVEFLRSKNSLFVIPFDFTDNISGILVRSKTTTTIGFNETHHEHRQRFTVAHEIGHFLMKHQCETKSDDSREKEANAFAAELLMPSSFLKIDYQKSPQLEALASKYVVSQQALCIHLMACKILKF